MDHVSQRQRLEHRWIFKTGFGDKCFHLTRIHSQFMTMKIFWIVNKITTLVLDCSALVSDILHKFYIGSLAETHTVSKA